MIAGVGISQGSPRMSQKRKSTESSSGNPLHAVASMKFWARFKNPPPLLAFSFAESLEDTGPSLDRLLGLPTVSVNDSLVYSLRISLDGSKPPVWRQVLVPAITLKRLHHIIQVVMGWDDAHLHGFEVRKIRVPLVEDGAPIDEGLISIAQLFAAKIKKFQYTYDFGDEWRHTIEIKEVLEGEPDVSYPQCINGKGSCPIEDVGGMWHWMKLLETLQNPDRERQEEMDSLLDRVGDNYSPAPFDLNETNARLQRAFHKRQRRKGSA